MGTDTLARPDPDQDSEERSFDPDTATQDDYDKRFNDILDANDLSSKEGGEEDDDSSSDAEDSEKDDLENGGYYKGNKGDDENSEVSGNGSKRSKKLLIGGGTGIVAGGVVAFLLFLPAAKLNLLMESINQRAFAVGSNAIQHRVALHVENYMAKVVFPSIKGTCGNQVTNTCVATSKNTLAGKAYAGWKDNRFEQKLFDDMGIELKYNVNATAAEGRYNLSDRFGRTISLTDGDIKRGGWLNGEPGKNELGKNMRKYIRENTKWYEFSQRHSLYQGLKTKYDLNIRCFFMCRSRDKAADAALKPKLLLKKKLVQRVVYPISSRYGLILECIVDGSCHDPSSSKARKILDNEKLEKRLTEKQVSEILERFEKEPGKKLSAWVAEDMLKVILRPIMKEGAETAAKSAADAVPVVGQIYLGLQVTDIVNEFWYGLKNHTLGKYASKINADQYIQYYTSMRSAADEAKGGLLDPAKIAALVTEFDGGGESMVYQAYQPKNEVITSLLGSNKAYASAATESYKCGNGKPIPAGELVCPEKKIAVSFFFEDWASSDFAKTVDQVSNNYEKGCDDKNRNDLAPPHCFRAVVHNTLKGINALIGFGAEKILEGGEATLRLIPGVGGAIDSVKQFANEKLGEATNWIFNKVMPIPIKDDSPAREKVDGLYAGSELVASDFAKGGYGDNGKPYGLGGVPLTDQQTADILRQEKEQKDYERSKESFIARLTDFDDPNSMTGQLIMNSPTEPSQFASMLFGGVQGIFSGSFFGRALAMPFAQAEVSNSDVLVHSPFGVPKIGYPINDPSLSVDPESLTPEKCQEYKKAWEESKYEDEKTGITYYRKTNPCLLDQVAVEDAGMMYTTAFDDSSGNTTASDPTTIVSGDTTNIACSAGTDKGTGDGYQDGKLVKIRLCDVQGITVNSQISGKLEEMINAAKGAGVTLSGGGFRTMEEQISLRNQHGCSSPSASASSCSPPTARPGYSNHQMGLAIDFQNCSAGGAVFNWLKSNAATYGFKNLPSESWHWSVDGH